MIFSYAKDKEQVKQWDQEGGIMILSYDLFMTITKEQFYKLRLKDPGANLLICDEGHILKNKETKKSKVVNGVRTTRRILLTGTPMQNNLKECKRIWIYVSMI